MKKFTTFFLALSLSLMLVGCGTEKKETEATTTEAATETEAVTTEAVTETEAVTTEAATETEAVTTEAATETEAATTEAATETEAALNDTAESEEYNGFYVMHGETMVFHKSDCEEAGKIPGGSYEMSMMGRNELVEAGYFPCQVCNP